MSASGAPPHEWMLPVKAIAFDCFGTLVNFVDQHFIEAFDAICSENALGITGKALWDSWLAHGRELAVERGRDPKNPLAGSEPQFVAYRQTYAQQFERAFRTADCIADPVAACSRIVGLLGQARCFPEVPEVLDALGGHYRLAVLSNADEDFLRACLEFNGLDFEVVVSSESAGSYKPRPAIFHSACDALGMAPSNVLYVGDSPIADVLGARAAGLPVAWVNRTASELPERIPQPNVSVSDLRSLLQFLNCGDLRQMSPSRQRPSTERDQS
jgi:2-haloalkanoic acid dehalogenase type II